MVKNMHQYRITRRRIKEFTKALNALDINQLDERAQLIQRIEIDAIRTQLLDLQAEVDHFESLGAGRTPPQPVVGIGSIPTALIETRIARCWTQQDFADALGIKAQVLQRYEATDFAGCSYATLLTFGKTLGLEANVSR